MTIKLKENSKPNISKICFECDNELHKKLNEFELSKDFKIEVILQFLLVDKEVVRHHY